MPVIIAQSRRPLLWTYIATSTYVHELGINKYFYVCKCKYILCHQEFFLHLFVCQLGCQLWLLFAGSIHSEICISGYNVDKLRKWTNFATVKSIHWQKVWQQMHTQVYRLLAHVHMHTGLTWVMEIYTTNRDH